MSDPAQRLAKVSDELPSTGVNSQVVPRSFRALYRDYFDFVWSCARRMGVGENEMDDVVQEIFIIIHGRLATLEKPESLRSWIYGIIRRTVSTYHRSRRMKTVSAVAVGSEIDLHCPQQLTPQDLAEQSDEVKALWSLLAKLDRQKREVFILAEFDGMTAPEIAAIIDVPLNTVYSRLRAARQEVEAALAKLINCRAAEGWR